MGATPLSVHTAPVWGREASAEVGLTSVRPQPGCPLHPTCNELPVYRDVSSACAGLGLLAGCERHVRNVSRPRAPCSSLRCSQRRSSSRQTPRSPPSLRWQLFSPAVLPQFLCYHRPHAPDIILSLSYSLRPIYFKAYNILSQWEINKWAKE